LEEQTHPLRTLDAEDGTLMHTCLKGLAARGLDVVDAEEGQDGADEFG